MRQAGLKPKSHSSGIYWIRANSSNKSNPDREELGLFAYYIFWGVLFPIASICAWIANFFRRISDRG